VKVLAVDQLSSEQQERPTVAKAVTVEVTLEQAQKVLLATNIGKLSLILRRPGDGSADPTRRVTERDLGRIDGKIVPTVVPRRRADPARVAAAPAPPANTVQIAVVRNNNRVEYTVSRSED
jgi:pilus assembly protein CpaB